MNQAIPKSAHLIGVFCLLVMPFLITYHPEILPNTLTMGMTLIGVISLSIIMLIYNDEMELNLLTLLLCTIFVVLLIVTMLNETEAISRTRLFIYSTVVVVSSLLGYNINKQYCSVECLLKVVMWGGVFIAIISVIIFYASSAFGLDDIISHNHTRISGPIAQANLLAISLFVALGATLQLFIGEKISKMPALVILFVLSYVFFGTLSRAILLGFVIYYALILALSDAASRKKLFVSGVVFLSASLIFLWCNDALMSYAQAHQWIPVQVGVENKYFDRSLFGFRLSEWHKAWILFLDNPIFGVGFDKFGANSVSLNYLPWAIVENKFPTNSHNIFFQLIAEFGLVGLLVAVVLFIYSVKYVIHTKHNKLFILAIFFPFFINSNVEYVLWQGSYAAFIVFLLSFFESSKSRYQITINKIYLVLVPIFCSVIILFTIPAYREVLRIMNGGPVNMETLYKYSAHPIYSTNFSYAFVRVSNVNYFVEDENLYGMFSQELDKQLALTPDPIMRFKAMQKAIYDQDDKALHEHYQQMKTMFNSEEAMLNFFKTECVSNQPLCLTAHEYVVDEVSR